MIISILPKGRARSALGQTFRGLQKLLRGLPAAHPIGCRANRLNRVASEIENAKDYLEIGVKEGFTLSSVNLRNKSGVDPHLMFNRHLAWGIDLYEVTSDEFFSGLPDDLRWDLIFLDGLHTFDQTSRDFVNALKHLRPGGAIVIDDVVPSSWEKALPDREESIRLETLNNGKADGAWFGDVWKLTVAISELFGDSLDVRTYGFGACGQSVVRYRLKYGVVPDIREAAFGKFKTLAYSDYFPSDGKVLLPGYQSEKTID